MSEGYEYWKELYLLHSESSLYLRRLEKTAQIVNEFLNKGLKVILSVSGGKDSVAMAHLVTQIAPNTKVVSEKDDMDFPNEIPYMLNLKNRYQWDLDIITPNVSLWSVIENFDITEDIHSKGTNFSETYFYGLLRKYHVENDVQGVFLGLRAQESKGRLYNRKKRGLIYFNNSWQQWMCTPIVEWEAKDVFAYLFSNDIPILDVYFKTNFVGTPEKIRKSWILPSAQSSNGQALWLKYYYPDIFNRLAKLNPKLRTFT